PAAAGVVDDAQDVPRPQRAPAFLGVVEEVDGRQAAGQVIDVADADEPVVEEVAPLLRREGVVDEGAGVTEGVLGGVVRPALVGGLEGVVAVVQGELLPADGRLADADLDDALVGLADAALAAVGAEALDEDAEGPAGGAGGAARPEEGVAEAA